jgi:heat shock protein HslJ
MIRPISAFSAAAAACVLSACQAPQPAPATSSFDRLIGTWDLESVPGANLAAARAAGLNGTPYITFEPDGGAFGFAGVNRMRGQLDSALVKSGGFKLGPMATTMMAGPPEVDEVERAVLGALGKADGFALVADRLSLTAAGREVIAFTRRR